LDFASSIPEDNGMSDRRSRLARAAWRTLTTREVYANPWIRVREDIAELPDGRTTLYGVIEVPPAVGVLPFLDARTVVLVGQYRYVARGFYWEMPTGGMKAGETEEGAALRELAEEAGYEASRLAKLCTFSSSKSICNEVAHPTAPTASVPSSSARTTPSSSRRGRSRSTRCCAWWSGRRSWTR
jgi:ADP-ribose pyrophosphatase